MLPEASDYAQWLKDNPAPDLGELVWPFGRYDRIPAWAWPQFDREMEVVEPTTSSYDRRHG